jgi:hypothetical protein
MSDLVEARILLTKDDEWKRAQPLGPMHDSHLVQHETYQDDGRLKNIPWPFLLIESDW